MKFKRLFRPLLVALALASCGGGGSGGGTATSGTSAPSGAPTPTPTPSPTATTMPMPMPTGTSVPTGTLAGLAKIESGINVADNLTRSWGTGEIPLADPTEVVGAFRFLCAPSHNAYDDPIVYPGQPGKSHLHTFFGNTLADANSTYESLRKTGDSSCNNLLNRSAYWVPAMMNGRGKVVMPDYVAIYYKRLPASSPVCQREGRACIALPRGLRYIFGYNMSKPSDSNPFWFNCDGPGARSGMFANIAQAAKGCPAGARLGAVIHSPSCWNGTQLDSPDHRSHMAYPSYGDWGYEKCPDTHPYVLPTFTLGAWYTTDASLDRSGNESADADTWYFTSDRMPNMPAAVPGTTFHTDWFGAWEDSILELWTANCIDKLLSCSGGDLGNGTQLKTIHGYDYANRTILVDPPAKPS